MGGGDVKPHSVGARPICLSVKSGVLVIGFTCLWEVHAPALTLLSSADVSTVSVPLLPSTYANISINPGTGGRQGPTLQPLSSFSLPPQDILGPIPAANIPREDVRPEAQGPDPGRPLPRSPFPRSKTGIVMPRPRADSKQREKRADISAPSVSTTDTSPEFTSLPDLSTTSGVPLSVEFGIAAYNQYYFRGVRILDAVSSDHTHRGVAEANFLLGYAREHDALSAGFIYVQALERQEAKGENFQVPPNAFKRLGRTFDLSSRARYEEYDLNVAYTRDLVANFRGTLEYNRYTFSNGQFYQTLSSSSIPFADEAVVKIDYLVSKRIVPSVSWAHDFDGFRGDFLEGRLNGDFRLPDLGGIGVELRPYMSVSYDLRYNGSDNGWNSFELGATIPFHLNSCLTFGLNANYVKALSESAGSPRANDGFWGGANFTIDWGGPIQGKASPVDPRMHIETADPRRWEVSLGAGYREFHYDFGHKPVEEFDLSRIFKAPAAISGSSRFAGDNNAAVFYKSGAIFGQTSTPQQLGAGFTPASSGVRRAFINDPNAQFFGVLGKNGYVTLTSDVNSFATTSKAQPGFRKDADADASIYLNFDRELWRTGACSLRFGLGYGFAESSGDSGYHVARVDAERQTSQQSGFDYAVDNFGYLAGMTPLPSATPLVIVDAHKYASSLLASGAITPASAAYLSTLTPAKNLSIIRQDVAVVATFARSNLTLDLHELSLPVGLREDLGHGLHAELTVGPTVTLAAVQLTTDLEQRSLAGFELGVPKTTQPIKFTPPDGTIAFPPTPSISSLAGGHFVLNPAARLTSIGVKVISAPAVLPPSEPVPIQSLGGKTVTPKAATFPGKLVSQSRDAKSQVSALVGMNVTAKLQLDLNSDGTFYAEVWGRYHYSEPLQLDNSFGNGRVDLSGFQAGMGFGCRF